MINSICVICKNKTNTEYSSGIDYISGEKFLLMRCVDCDLVTTDFDFKKDNLTDYYGSQYYGNRKSSSEDMINNLRMAEVFRIVRSDKKRSLLDIGCGNGSFFMKFRKVGWPAFGTEVAPPDHLRSGAREFIYKGDLPDNNFKDESFEVVTMWHSLEHIINPLEYLCEVRRILTTNGYFIAEVPNFKSWQSIIFKKNWFHLDVPRHLIHFSPEGLALVAQKSGFRDVKVKSGSLIYQLYGYLQSVLNVFSRRKNMLFDLLNGKIHLVDTIFKHPLDLVVNLIILMPALIFSLIFSVLEGLTGHSGIILVSARK